MQQLWRCEEPPGRRGKYSRCMLTRAIDAQTNVVFQALHAVCEEIHLLKCHLHCSTWINALFERIRTQAPSIEEMTERMHLSKVEQAGALADLQRLIAVGAATLGVNVLTWLTRASSVHTLVLKLHGVGGGGMCQRIGESDRLAETIVRVYGQRNIKLWKPDRFKDMLYHAQCAFLPQWAPECAKRLQAAPAMRAYVAQHPQQFGPLLTKQYSPGAHLHLGSLWTAYSEQQEQSKDSTAALNELERCETELRRAVAAVMLSNSVGRNLRAIKARLWRPQGRLVQRLRDQAVEDAR